MSKDWFILYTKPRAEKKLKKKFDELGLENYLPLITLKKRWSDRWKIIDTPLFPSYIFIKIDFSAEANLVLKNSNVVCFLNSEGRPATLNESDISFIKIFIEKYPEKIKIEEAEKIKVGKEIEIKNGVFTGMKGIIEKIKNKSYLILKLNSMNKSIRVEININDLGLSL
jgi:transcription antitermination factor NusG